MASFLETAASIAREAGSVLMSYYQRGIAFELKGEFDCKQVEGIEPGGVKTYKVHIKGTFSAPR